MRGPARGIGLLSGGLDSALACLVLREAGAEIECLHFLTGFCVPRHNRVVGRTNRPTTDSVARVAAEIGVPLELVDISEDYLSVVLGPKHGYGKNMNPCVDCRVLMLRKARERMEARGADFVFTGEVVGQRLKSQVKTALRVIERETGLERRLLRPLCAKLLPPTEVEKRGLVDRGRLHALNGRGRRPQLELAARYGLTTHGQPGGGCCFLTDRAYSRKLKDAIAHAGEGPLTVEDAFMLGVGRHFRLAPTVRVIVGRDAVENEYLARCSGGRWLARAIGFTGPVAMVLGEMSESHWELIASIVARYSDGKDEVSVDIEFARATDRRRIAASPASEGVIEAHRI
jgi:tRNA-specific 2-thiouridylase